MKKYALMALVIALSNFADAAKPVDLSTQPLSFLSDKTRTTRSFQVPAVREQTKESGRLVDPNHMTHIGIYQTYAGYRVYGTDAIVHTRQSVSTTRRFNAMLPSLEPQNTQVNGIFYKGLAQDLKQAPETVFKTREQAVRSHVLSLMSARYYDDFETRHLTMEPMIYVDTNQQAHYAFYIALILMPKQAQIPVEPVYIIDAIDLKVYKNWNNVKSEAVKGGGFGGNPKNPLIYDGQTVHLPKLDIERDDNQKLCFMKNADVFVYDFDRIGSWEHMNTALQSQDAIARFACESPSGDHESVYWNADFDKQNEGYSPNNDALFAGNTVQKMFQDWYNVDVTTMLQNSDKPQLKMVTHIAAPGQSEDLGVTGYHHFENAFWTDYFNAIFLGDGGDEMYPLTSLGVMTHEISHGITSHRQLGGLVYEGQSGALNESFSDMAAQAAQYFVYGKMDGQIGADIMKAPDQALRYMDKPSRDCGSDRQPGDFCSIDHVSQYNHLKEMAYQYTGSEDQAQSVIVHYASGIFNRAFYVLATTPDWDPKKAFHVMVWANLYEWRATTDFNCAGKGVVDAAKALHDDVNAVLNALDQVGVTPRCGV